MAVRVILQAVSSMISDLHREMDSERFEVNLKDGVLNLRISKREGRKQRKIQVWSG